MSNAAQKTGPRRTPSRGKRITANSRTLLGTGPESLTQPVFISKFVLMVFYLANATDRPTS